MKDDDDESNDRYFGFAVFNYRQIADSNYNLQIWINLFFEPSDFK